jgi:hypothetical protein
MVESQIQIPSLTPNSAKFLLIRRALLTVDPRFVRSGPGFCAHFAPKFAIRGLRRVISMEWTVRQRGHRVCQVNRHSSLTLDRWPEGSALPAVSIARRLEEDAAFFEPWSKV